MKSNPKVSKDFLNTQITALGLIATAFIAAAFYFWSGSLANHGAIFKSAALGVSLQFALWWLSRLWDYPKALLGTTVAIAFLSLVPSAGLILYAFGGILGISFLRKVIGQKSKSSGVDLFCIALFGAMAAVVVFDSLSQNVGDPFIDEKIRGFALNADTLYHVSLSTMIKNYGVVSTGMHGLALAHYHFFVHLLYAAVSKLLSLEVYDVFGYSNFIVFAPLMMTGWMRAAASILKKTDLTTFVLINLVVFGGPFSEIYSYDSSHFISESFQLSLLFLSGAMAALSTMIENREVGTADLLIVLTYLPLLCLSKISVGCIFLALFFVVVVLSSKQAGLKKLCFLILSTLVWVPIYLLVKQPSVPNLEVRFKWNYYKSFFYAHHSFPYFLNSMFPYFVLLAPLFILLWANKQMNRKDLTWFGLFTASFLIGFFGLNLTIDSSGYYFSAVNGFIAIVVLAYIFSKSSFDFRQIFKRTTLAQTYENTLALILVLCVGFFLARRLPMEFKRMVLVKSKIVANMEYKNQYWPLFERVHNDPDKYLMVYIPKSETTFWDNTDGQYSPWFVQQCINMPFYTPILTGKPAIFGLPDPAKKCFTFVRGYESYSENDYAISAAKDYSHEDLCRAIQAKGFHGYYKITQGSAIKFLCETAL